LGQVLNQKLENTIKVIEIWLEGLPFPVYLTKQIFTNKDGSTAQTYLITNDKALNNQPNEIHKSITNDEK